MANRQFSIDDNINKQAQGLQLEEQTQTLPVNNDIELVRYKGGEKVKDSEGNEFKAKKNEPENGYEWSLDAADRVWNSGKSMDEVEKELNKKYPLSSAIIKDERDGTATGKKKYYGSYETMDPDTYEKKGIRSLSPRERAEWKLAEKYGFSLGPTAYYKETSVKPSTAAGLLNKTGLKKDWESIINADWFAFDYDKNLGEVYNGLRTKLEGLQKPLSEKELKKLGFNSQEDYDSTVNYLLNGLDNLNKYINKRLDRYKSGDRKFPYPVSSTSKDIPFIEETGEDNIPSNNNVHLARYKGGELVKDNSGIDHKAKKGEPEYGSEWAQDAAQRVWDSGKSMDEVESEMNKKWPLASAIIKDNETIALNAGDPESRNYNKYVQYYDKRPDGDNYFYFRSPREQTEAVLAERYGLYLPDNPVIQKDSPTNPSTAVGFINKANLKEDWENWLYMKGARSHDDFLRNYTNLRSKLLDLSGIKSEKELKKLGFNSQEDYNLALSYLVKSVDEFYKDRDRRWYGKETNTETPITKPDNKAVPIKAKEDVKKETNTEAVPDSTENIGANTETVPVSTEEAGANTETNEESEGDSSFAVEEARLNTEMSEQEKQAQEEADAIAKKELTRKEAEELEREIESAAKKKQQDLFDYEDWLKNPTIISGIFGKSGLSMARRVGLGLATLFAIFSDVAANYGKGINNNTDFKTAAMDQLNSTIAKIHDKRSEAIGEMAAKPYSTATENEEKLNREYEKLRRLPAGTYIPKRALQTFIQESQLDTDEPMSDSLYNQFTSEARDGYIDSIKKSRKLRAAYLNEDGTLNADGELAFLKKQEVAINQYKNALKLSDERLKNINSLLDADKKRAEVRAKVHDVIFQTNADYINAINAMESENRALEESKLGFTEARTLDAMLNLAQKNRNVIAGLATSSANTTEGTSDTEASLNRFSEQGGIEKVNEELEKHGWQAQLNAEAGAKFPVKVVPISAKISAGGKWTSEQANKHLQSEYEKWTRDDQRSLSKARNLSSASGKNVDEAYDEIVNFLNSEKAKGANADFNKVRQEVLDSINNKIQYNKQVIDELKEMREKERKFDTGENSSASTSNPYVSMFNDVPTKDSNWYRYRLALS